MPDRIRRLLSGAVTVVLAAVVIGAVVTADPPAADRAEAIGSKIRCPVCQGEAIADSPSGLAQDMMALVRARIDEGWTDDQIVDELLSSYTGSQLLDPPLTWQTVAFWAVPGLALVAGVVMALSRRREPAP